MLLAVLLGQRDAGGRAVGREPCLLDLRGETSADAGFASSLALSFIWTLCASAFIAVGMWRNFAPIRYLAMGLFGITVLKVFLVDLSALGGIYRILGFIGVGVVLLAVSFVYQRARRRSHRRHRRRYAARGSVQRSAGPDSQRSAFVPSFPESRSTTPRRRANATLVTEERPRRGPGPRPAHRRRRGERAQRAAGVVRQALRRRAEVRRKQLGAHRAKAAEVAGAEERQERTEDTSSQRTSRVMA